MNVALVLLALVAGAGAPDPRAVELFEEGAQAYEAGDFQSALDAFAEAHRISNEPVLLLNIGQCHRQLGNHEEAVVAFEAYLAQVPDAEDRAEVEELVKSERALIEPSAKPQEKRDEFKLPELKPEVSFDETTLWAIGGVAAGVVLVAAGVTVAVIAAQPPPPVEPSGTLGVVTIP